MGKHSPDKVLIACDSTETVLSALALTITLLAPHQAIWAVYAYTLIDLLILSFTDIAEEFYGAHFAQINEDTAMAFNASLSTIQATVNFVVAGIAGSLLAGGLNPHTTSRQHDALPHSSTISGTGAAHLPRATTNHNKCKSIRRHRA